MMKNKHLSKTVVDQKFFKFRTKLMSKCNPNNTKLKIVDK